MAVKSKIKWVALIGLALSALSLATHFLLARFYRNEVQVGPREIQAFLGWSKPIESASYAKVWSKVKHLQNLRPYFAPRKSFPAPRDINNGFLFAHIEGEFHEIRTSICDLVVVARILNATLVLPVLEEVVSVSRGISAKYKGFGYIYDEKHFIAALKRDILAVKTLPKELTAFKKQKENFMKPSLLSTPEFYLKEVLPVLKAKGVLGLLVSGGGCLKNSLPARHSEYQRLRCRVAFEALHFRKEVQELGARIVQRLQAFGQPYLAYHTGLEQGSLAFHGCGERFQDLHTELIQNRRARMIKSGHIKGNLSVDSEIQWRNGYCPLMPEEVGILLHALGYGPHTRIYISGGEIFGGQRVLIPLRAMYNNLEDRTTLTTEEERHMIYGPEDSLPSPPPPPPPPSPDDVQKMLAAWKTAGPRPRPLPPPPSRNIYVHELEGWWGWLAVTDEEPPQTVADLRLQGHKLLWAALDYIVCIESTAFFPGFDLDSNGRPNFASLVMGHRAFISPYLRTYRPDRRAISKLIEEAGDKAYHPKFSWTMSTQKILKSSLDFTKQQDSLLIAKQDLFLSHPVPECSCRLSAKARTINDSSIESWNRKNQSYGYLDACPYWMENDVTNDSEDNESETDEELQLSDATPEVAPNAAESDKTTEKEDNQGDAEEDIDAND